jgi:chaperonin GroES
MTMPANYTLTDLCPDGKKWPAPNASGIMPTEFKVLLKPKEVQEKTKGGIILPDETKDRDQFAQMEGMIVAVSPLAFTYSDDWGSHQPPKPGDRVLFAKYSGAKVTGKDGQEYRIVSDKDIAAVLT